MKKHFNQRAEGAGTPHFSLIDRIAVQDFLYHQEGPAFLGVLGVMGCAFRPDAATVADFARIGATPLCFYEVSGRAGAECFRNSIANAMQKNTFGKAVEIKAAESYTHLRLFLNEEGSAGFAIDGDGSIVSVFRAHEAPIAKATISVMTLALQCGGDRLDAFDTVLPHLYSRMGFRVVARLAWDPACQPEGWDKHNFQQYHGGEPDIVFMSFDPGHGKLYVPGDGVHVSRWDDGVALQDACRIHVRKAAPVGLPGQKPVLAPK
ncbi:MAG TPA: hypothetical protein DCW68_05695 [Rhodospirillaceae bacterium]|nr:MAG: hypothetical protein A2018_01965 [Alphaproteobacteria bacterium GWF2_58_20]HAU29586.1 hypothetical protein [Rhodospirillaceae bacterium]